MDPSTPYHLTPNREDSSVEWVRQAPIVKPMTHSTSMSRSAGLARVRRLFATGMARQIREAHHVSQGEMATDIGASQAALSRWESGSRVPTGDAALRCLDVLDELNRQQ
jgi:DNA-binding transcriptional regulator YiaG